MTPVRVHVHIGTLALPSATAAGGSRVAAALERELQRALRTSGAQVDFSPRSIAKLDGGSFQASAAAGDHVIGYRMARSIFAGMAGFAGQATSKAGRHG